MDFLRECHASGKKQVNLALFALLDDIGKSGILHLLKEPVVAVQIDDGVALELAQFDLHPLGEVRIDLEGLASVLVNSGYVLELDS